jgi:hypothetical protein
MNRGRKNHGHVFVCHMDLLERGVLAHFPGNIKINLRGKESFEEAGGPKLVVSPLTDGATYDLLLSSWNHYTHRLR